jgi:hypothetical protein
MDNYLKTLTKMMPPLDALASINPDRG